MKDILKDPFSTIIRKEETEFIMVTPPPKWDDEIKEAGQDYIRLFRPTRLFYEYGLTVKNTMDGEVNEHVLIWHAKWDHEEETVPPQLVGPLSAN